MISILFSPVSFVILVLITASEVGSCYCSIILENSPFFQCVIIKSLSQFVSFS